MTGRAIRLASFNLFSGRTLIGGTVDHPAMLDAVAALDADVVALQEVDYHQPRSGGVDQAAAAAAALGAVDHRFVGLVHGTPGEPGWQPVHRDHLTTDRVHAGLTDHLAGPSYGIALASRVEVESWHVLAMRPARGRYPIPLPGTPPGLLWLHDEPRAVLAAVLRSPRMTVACAHLSFVPGANVRQLRAVRRFLAGLPGPQVLLGDLNLPGRLPSLITRWQPLVTGETFPAPAPRLQLDHALARGLPEGTAVVPSLRQLPISDHRAVIADLHLPA